MTSSTVVNLIKSLNNKGWCFRDDVDNLHSIITLHSAASSTVDSLEAELCNLDLRAVGGKSLPEPSLLRKSSLLIQPPKLLQVVSGRDISRSSGVDGYKTSSNRRLLRVVLTDGHSEVTAIEYSPIPSLPDDIVPGTKLRLETKVKVIYGIFCLTPDAVAVVGGVVPALYEEWQMNQKYSGFSRSSLRLGRESDSDGPPSFEKLQVGRHASARNVSRKNEPTVASSSKETESQQMNQKQAFIPKGDTLDIHQTALTSPRAADNPTSSDARPREVAEFVPIQNQAAAQKLLQKMNTPNHRNDGHRYPRFKGKDIEEKTVFTLDEWERRKVGPNRPVEVPHDVMRDEDLAWQLQNQFNIEDQEQSNPHRDKAEDIKMSMFSFDRDNDSGIFGRAESRGRGGRGRGRSRGRGRGRGSARGRG